MAKKITKGTTGDCTWTLDENGLLTISGNGAMGNYTYLSSSPWGTNIKSVIIENGVTSIGNYAFRSCDALTNITIPNSVTNIGHNAFWGCKRLTNITIPDSVTNIGGYAFDKCKRLTSITIPNSVTTIGNLAFTDCKRLTSVTIGNSVTTINEMAFFNCTGLTSVTIPDSVTAIGNKAFGYYYSDDNYGYVKTDGFTIYCNKNSKAENYAKERGINYLAI